MIKMPCYSSLPVPACPWWWLHCRSCASGIRPASDHQSNSSCVSSTTSAAISSTSANQLTNVSWWHSLLHIVSYKHSCFTLGPLSTWIGDCHRTDKTLGHITKQWRRFLLNSGGRHGERVEHEPITGVCGQSPQRGPGAEPLVRGSEGWSPPEAERKLNFDNTITRLILH